MSRLSDRARAVLRYVERQPAGTVTYPLLVREFAARRPGWDGRAFADAFEELIEGAAVDFDGEYISPVEGWWRP